MSFNFIFKQGGVCLFSYSPKKIKIEMKSSDWLNMKLFLDFWFHKAFFFLDVFGFKSLIFHPQNLPVGLSRTTANISPFEGAQLPQ